MTTTRLVPAAIVGVAVLAVVVFAGLLSASATSGPLTILVDTVLTEDHDGNVVIGADNVTLDCAGYTVMGTGTDGSAGIGVLVQGRTSVTVKNCHVTNFFQGFAVGGSTAIDLTANSANSNGEGFLVGDSSTDTTLTGNTANNNNTWGFIVASVSGNTLVGNEASGNTVIGFALNGASGNEFRANRASGHDTNFDLGNSSNNTLTDNIADGGFRGFHLGDSDGNTFENNKVAGTTGGAGFILNNSSNNVFVGNLAENNQAQGFHVFLGSMGNQFIGNVAHFSTDVGFRDSTTDSGTAGTGNTYVDNICLRNTHAGSDPVGLCDPSGTFVDDDGNTFEFDIEWMAGEGITKGCNAAQKLFCPDDLVTRGQMAAFLVRALGYVDDGGGDLFTDDDGHTFENDIDKLGTAGVTKGCNPPTNDRYCPDDLVTRGQMAAFLVRALGYTDNGGGNLFTDDDGHTFENDIDKLGTAGVTKGCNPPINDRFCPDDFVTRGAMAAFLHRALG